jgi:Transcriptional regulator, AbiEi antitoxin/Protein of unknown function (DUF559)
MGDVGHAHSENGSWEGVDVESETYVRFYGQRQRPDLAIAQLAAEQHGVVTLAQLGELGLQPRAVQLRAASGRLHRIHRGVYALAPPQLLSRDGRFMAAVLACGQQAVLSHRSAAALHELRATERAAIDVTVPGRTCHKRHGIDLHRSKTLKRQDTTTVNRIPCTTVARTQFDLAEAVNRRAVERAYDQAEILELFDLRALHDQLARNNGRHGLAVVRTILAEHYPGTTATWSELEERFLALIRSAGVPAPEVNAWVVPDDGEPAIRVDFMWRPRGLIVETDGMTFHHTRRGFQTDRRRDQRLTLAGWRVVRVTWGQLTGEPARVGELIRALLADA